MKRCKNPIFENLLTAEQCAPDDDFFDVGTGTLLYGIGLRAPGFMTLGCVGVMGAFSADKLGLNN
jgi:hypothetical protein